MKAGDTGQDFTAEKRDLAKWRVVQAAKQLRRTVDDKAAQDRLEDAYTALTQCLDELEALGG